MKIISSMYKVYVNNISKRTKNNNSIQSREVGFGNNVKENSIEQKDKNENKHKAKSIALSTVPLVGAFVLGGVLAYKKRYSNMMKRQIENKVEKTR